MATVDIGGDKDELVLVLGDTEVTTIESYDIEYAFLTQPAAFSVKMGSDGTARELAGAYPPRTPFKLRITCPGQAPRTIASGALDGTELSGPPTSVTFQGRDNLQFLHDAFVRNEKTFVNATFQQLVQGALKEVGLGDAVIVFTNQANRKAITGGNVKQIQAPKNIAEETVESIGGGKIFRTPQAKLGERWYEFLKRHLDRVGLFLWCGAELDEKGNPFFVLSEPNTKQRPLYRVVHKRGATIADNAASVLKYTLRDTTQPRFSEAIIYARGGGKSFGRGKAKGSFVEDEMVALGYKRPIVMKDVECQNAKQAEFLARRRLAEANRAGHTLTYTVSGHSVPALGGGRAVWAPDTIVDVQDDELGIHGPYWVERVHFSRSDATTTTITLMKPEDVIFGDLGGGA